MLYEFAITPDVFDKSTVEIDSTLAFILIELLKGLRENGMIANLHKGRWIEHVKSDRIEYLSPGTKDRLIRCLNILSDRHRLVRHPRSTSGDPTNDGDWLHLALESHARIPFHGVVLSKSLLDLHGRSDGEFLELSEVLDSKLWEERSHSLILTKSETDYQDALAPVLRHAKALNLIDPYMSCHESRFWNMVELCIHLLGQRGHAVLPGRVHIHAGNPENDSANTEPVQGRLNEWERKLRSFVARYPHKFRVFLWGESSGGQRMHDRFILTDQIGISVPAGLDYRKHSVPISTTWTLLDEKDRIRRLEDYDQATSPFRLLGQRDIS